MKRITITALLCLLLPACQLPPHTDPGDRLVTNPFYFDPGSPEPQGGAAASADHDFEAPPPLDILTFQQWVAKNRPADAQKGGIAYSERNAINYDVYVVSQIFTYFEDTIASPAVVNEQNVDAATRWSDHQGDAAHAYLRRAGRIHEIIGCKHEPLFSDFSGRRQFLLYLYAWAHDLTDTKLGVVGADILKGQAKFKRRLGRWRIGEIKRRNGYQKRGGLKEELFDNPLADR